MDALPTRNRALARILQDMLEARERAGEWVKGDSEFDPESKRMMGVMNDGDRETVISFASWLESLDTDLPITVSSPDGGRNWVLEIDADGCQSLPDRDRDMLEAMAHLLFDGPEPGPENRVVEELMGLGLPDKLRRDLSDS